MANKFLSHSVSTDLTQYNKVLNFLLDNSTGKIRVSLINAVSSGATELAQLNDCLITSNAIYHFLMWNGSKWVNTSFNANNLPSYDFLTNLILTSPSGENDHYIVYEQSTGKWKNKTIKICTKSLSAIAPSDLQVLGYSSILDVWSPATIGLTNGMISDCVTTSLTNNQVLKWNSTLSKFTNGIINITDLGSVTFSTTSGVILNYSTTIGWRATRIMLSANYFTDVTTVAMSDKFILIYDIGTTRYVPRLLNIGDISSFTSTTPQNGQALIYSSVTSKYVNQTLTLNSISDVYIGPNPVIQQNEIIIFDTNLQKWTNNVVSINIHGDVNINNVQNGQILRWQAGTPNGYWINSNETTQPIPDLDNLSNILISSKSDNDILKWDANASKWVNSQPVAGVTNLDGLSDVVITSPSAQDIILYNGLHFINRKLFSDELGDHLQISTPAANHLYIYNSTSNRYENKLLNISQLGDCVISSATNGQILQYSTALNKWYNATAMFPDVNALGVRFGSGSVVQDYGVALGQGSNAGSYSIAIGASASASIVNGCAIGYASSTNSIAYCIGIQSSIINSTYAFCFGVLANITNSPRSVLIGGGQISNGPESVVIGYQTSSGYANCLVLSALSSGIAAQQASSCYMAPLRNLSSVLLMQYNTTTKEVTQSDTFNGLLTLSNGISVTGGTQSSTVSSTFNLVCDIRTKQNIIKRDPVKVLDNIQKLDVYEYNYINKKQTRVGLIAQEVENIEEYQDCVLTSQGVTKYENVDIENLKMVNYDKINVDLIICCQELIKQNKQLNNKIELMEDKINMLMDKIYNIGEQPTTIPDPVKITNKSAIRKTVSIKKS